MKIVKNSRGSAMLIAIAAFSVVAMTLSSTLAVIALDRSKKSSSTLRLLSLRTTTRSSFILMEEALKRRFWTPPPDADCLASEDFSVSLSTVEGIDVNIVAKFDAPTKNIILQATGVQREKTVVYRKVLRVMDVSDFLVYSKGNKPMKINRSYEADKTVGLLAGSRRFYTEGQLLLRSSIAKTPNPTSWSDTVSTSQKELGLIIQSERLNILGGISYSLTASSDLPNDTSSTEYSMLKPIVDRAISLGGYPVHRDGSGFAILTRDYTKAKQLQVGIDTKNLASAPTVSSMKKYIYPPALFCGTPPLYADVALDVGCYHNDPSKNYVFSFTYGGANNYSRRADYTCSSLPGKKVCSDSNDFPKGFDSWRRSADLEGVLFTKESQPIGMPSIDWNNMEALEEDAKACGVVIESPEPGSYVDCDLGDKNFITKYLTMGSSVACSRISPVTLNNLVKKMNNFNPSVYSTLVNQDRFLRRIVYSKVPLEISQNSPAGLWMDMADPNIRANTPFWFANEKYFRLKPIQPDTTSPLDSDPTRIRELYFNEDSTSANTQSLKLVFLSPETMEVISPFHQKMTKPSLLSIYPVIGGKVKAKRHAITDYARHENDGYRYGVRNVRVKNVVAITNPGSLFNLRGLWSAEDKSSAKFLRGACMMDKPGDTQAYIGGVSAGIPTYASDPNPVVPPASSLFYGPSGVISSTQIPAVFKLQLTQDFGESIVSFFGLRVQVGFKDEVIPGLRNLGIRERATSSVTNLNMGEYDISDRKMSWDLPYYHETIPPAGISCTPANLKTRAEGNPQDFKVILNEGSFDLLHQNVNSSFKNAGAVFAIDLLETQEH